MKLTWYGHSAFGIETGDAKILIDPFLSGNPSWIGGWEEPAQGCTHVLVTHGHDDHLGDAFDICRKTDAMLVANFEICMYAVGQGVSDKRINPGNPGGTIKCGGFLTSFVQAKHGSSTQTENGENLYLGAACGLIIKAKGEKSVYHMGDTDVFSDMALIQELHEPEIGIVPVGDRFTMGAREASLACNRYFAFETIIPCHFGSFPVIDENASAFVEAMGAQRERVLEMKVGKPETL